MSLLTRSDLSEPQCQHRSPRVTITAVNARPYQLRTLVIGDDPASWADAGFAIDGATTRIANTAISLVGTESGRGILRATVDGIDAAIDGMPFGGHDILESEASLHPNGAVDFDHLVAMSPDMDRTTATLLGAGLEHRRTRTFDAGGTTRRQAFFWLGDVILELVGEDDAHGDGPALLWGLALTCVDLQATAMRLGDALGAAKPAVQRGREIATLRTKELGISVPIALMSPHASPAG